MRRIIIIGCGGAGKSMLAVKLGKKLNIPVVHLDRLSWRAGWQNVSRDEFDSRLLEELARPEWIIDGNYYRTLPWCLELCDCAVYLDYPRIVCLWGVISRVVRNHGRTRPDMADGCPERMDGEFLKWIWDYNRNFRTKLYDMLNSSGKRVVVLKSRREAQRLLDIL